MARMAMRFIIGAIAASILAIITIGILYPKPPAPSANTASSTNAHSSASPEGLLAGDRAPDFALTTLEGKAMRLRDYHGRPIMLTFWRVNCEGCRAEIPDMQKVYAAQQAAHKDFVILGVNMADGAAQVQPFVQERNLTYPILLDHDLAATRLYNVHGTPTNYFINRQGLIDAEIEGPINAEILQAKIGALSAGAVPGWLPAKYLGGRAW